MSWTEVRNCVWTKIAHFSADLVSSGSDKSLEVSMPGSNYISGFSRDNNPIGVSHQTSKKPRDNTSVSHRGHRSIRDEIYSGLLEGKLGGLNFHGVRSLGSLNRRSISRGDGTVGMADNGRPM